MINSYYEVHVTSYLSIDGKKLNFLDPSIVDLTTSLLMPLILMFSRYF